MGMKARAATEVKEYKREEVEQKRANASLAAERAPTPRAGERVAIALRDADAMEPTIGKKIPRLESARLDVLRPQAEKLAAAPEKEAQPSLQRMKHPAVEVPAIPKTVKGLQAAMDHLKRLSETTDLRSTLAAANALAGATAKMVNAGVQPLRSLEGGLRHWLYVSPDPDIAKGGVHKLLHPFLYADFVRQREAIQNQKDALTPLLSLAKTISQQVGDVLARGLEADRPYFNVGFDDTDYGQQHAAEMLKGGIDGRFADIESPLGRKVIVPATITSAQEYRDLFQTMESWRSKIEMYDFNFLHVGEEETLQLAVQVSAYLRKHSAEIIAANVPGPEQWALEARYYERESLTRYFSPIKQSLETLNSLR